MATVVVRLPAPVAVRAPAALLLVLVLPGWPWMLYNQRRRRVLESAALVVAASMGITIVTGVALDLMPGHLTDASWSLGLLLVTLAGALVLWIRSRQPELVPKADHPIRGSSGWWGAGTPVRRLVLPGAGSIVVLGLLGVLAIVSVESQQASYRQEHFTVLALRSASSDVLVVEIGDHEEATMHYRLTAVSQGRTVFRRDVTLRSGAYAAVPVRVGADTVLLDSNLGIDLSRQGHPGIYRSLSLVPREGRWP